MQAVEGIQSVQTEGGGSPRSQVVRAFTESTFVRMSPPDPASRDSPPHAHCIRAPDYVQGRVLQACQPAELGRSNFVNRRPRRFPEEEACTLTPRRRSPAFQRSLRGLLMRNVRQP